MLFVQIIFNNLSEKHFLVALHAKEALKEFCSEIIFQSKTKINILNIPLISQQNFKYWLKQEMIFCLTLIRLRLCYVASKSINNNIKKEEKNWNLAAFY